MSALKIPALGEYVRGIGRLILVTQNERDGGTDYIFEDVTAKYQVCLRGRVLSESETSWDFVGHLSSVESTYVDAVKRMQELQIKPREDNHVRIQMCRRLSRKRTKTAERDEYARNPYDHAYRHFEEITSGFRWHLPDDQRSIVWDSAESETLDMDAVRAIAAKPWDGLPTSVMPVDTVKVRPGIGSCHSCGRYTRDEEPLRVFEIGLGSSHVTSVRVCKPCARELVRQLSDAIGRNE